MQPNPHDRQPLDGSAWKPRFKTDCKRCGVEFTALTKRTFYCAVCCDDALREQLRAAALVNKHVRKGFLPRPDSLICDDCGEPAKVYDHRDYSKPLQVVPLCTACNLSRGPAKRELRKQEQRAECTT